VNSRWTRSLALGLALSLAGCGGKGEGPAAARAAAPPDPAQADAEVLGRELFEIMDRVVAYRASHQNRLPGSFRQAGLDTLTSEFLRGLGRVGADPQVTIRFRRPEGHALRSCAGTNLVLEQAMMNEGQFEVQCAVADGATRTFTVRRP
jgi:predicted small lipoprotein YifL